MLRRLSTRLSSLFRRARYERELDRELAFHLDMLAEQHVREIFDGLDVVVTDSAPGALPGLHAAAAQEFVASTGEAATAKYGWTDVARFAALGIPAVNYGPGDPNLAHHDEERCPVDQLVSAEAAMLRWLAGTSGAGA